MVMKRSRRPGPRLSGWHSTSAAPSLATGRPRMPRVQRAGRFGVTPSVCARGILGDPAARASAPGSGACDPLKGPLTFFHEQLREHEGRRVASSGFWAFGRPQSITRPCSRVPSFPDFIGSARTIGVSLCLPADPNASRSVSKSQRNLKSKRKATLSIHQLTPYPG